MLEGTAVLGIILIVFAAATLWSVVKIVPQGYQFTVEEFGRPKGFIGVEPNYPNSGYLRIHKFYVLPEQQGKGLGRVLFNQVVDTAFDVDCHKLHLNVNRFNKAVDFYKYLGFDVTGEENIDIGKDYLMEDFIMELELRS